MLTGHTGAVYTVAFGQFNGRPVIASGSDDQTVRVWDAATGRQLGDRFAGHTDAVTSVAFGQFHGRPAIASGSDDRSVRLWDAAAITA